MKTFMTWELDGVKPFMSVLISIAKLLLLLLSFQRVSYKANPFTTYKKSHLRNGELNQNTRKADFTRVIQLRFNCV